jgi:hypothetical protein
MAAGRLLLSCREEILGLREMFALHALVECAPGQYVFDRTELIQSSASFKGAYESLLTVIGPGYGVLSGQFITPEQWAALPIDGHPAPNSSFWNAGGACRPRYGSES